MDSEIERALQTDGLIDITTVGRTSGKPSKIEIARWMVVMQGMLRASRNVKGDWPGMRIPQP